MDKKNVKCEKSKKNVFKKSEIPATKKINLALQGGGAHGAFAWGILDQLLQDKRLEIDSISASSAGAVNATIFAQGFIDGGNEGARQALCNFWQDLSRLGQIYSPIKLFPWECFFNFPAENAISYFIFDLMTKVLSPYQLNIFNYNPMRCLLESHINFEQIRTSNKIKLFISATNVRTGKVKIFQNQEMSADVILASSCLPFLFQAVLIEGEYYWDGGYMGNPAIFPLIYESQSNDVLIIHINPIQREHIPQNAGEIVNRVNEISFNSSLMREMRAISFVTKLLDNDWIKPEHRDKIKRMYIHSIRADELMETFSVASKFNTEWSFLIKLFKLGSRAGVKWLDNQYEKIGKESSIEFNDFL